MWQASTACWTSTLHTLSSGSTSHVCLCHVVHSYMIGNTSTVLQQFESHLPIFQLSNCLQNDGIYIMHFLGNEAIANMV